jgi:hypothetical protein
MPSMDDLDREPVPAGIGNRGYGSPAALALAEIGLDPAVVAPPTRLTPYQ